MGSSCSSGPKKDKCSKKKKTEETNGGNHSQRGSDASVYTPATSVKPPASASCPATGTGTAMMAGPSTPSAIPGHEKAKVERVDSASVSSPMSPNQLLTRQASRDGTEIEIGRIDLHNIAAEVASLLTGNELKRLASSGQLVDGAEIREKDVFQPSFRCLNVVISRHETEGPKDEISSLDECVIELLRDHCRKKGYEVQLFVLDGDVSSDDWVWLCDERQAPLTVFILLCAESSSPANETVHSWSWLANNIISKSTLRRKAMAIWKHIIQSPVELSENQQKLLETLDEARVLKCSVKCSKGSIADQIRSMKSNLLAMITPMVDMMLDENERKDPSALNQPHYIGLSHSLYTELVHQFRLLQSYLKWYANKLWPNDLVQKVDEYVWSAGERPPLILYGSSGKSCLQAYLAHHLANSSNNSAHLVFRIIAQQQQTRFLSVFNNLIEQCCLLLAHPKPSSVQAADLPVLLSRVSHPETPLILLLDGLENVLPSSPSFTWLPTTLPCNVRLIITLNDTSPLLNHSRNILSSEAFLKIPTMVPENLCDIISKHLRNKQMDLSEPQQLVCHGAFRVNPSLSSVSILISAILLGRIPSFPSLNVESSLESQAEVLLASLEEELDPLFLSSLLCFLVLSKHGLSRLELASIMSPQFTALPTLELFQSIQRLVGWLEPALIGTIILHSTCLLTINCPYFRSAIRKRYLNPELQPHSEDKYSLHLKEFWEKQNNLERKWAELRDDKPIKIDPDWFLMKLKYGSVEDLIEELQIQAESQIAQQDVDNFVEFLTEIYQVLEYDGEQFFTQVYGRSSLPNKPSIILKQLLDQCVQSGFPCNSFISPVGSGALRLTIDADEAKSTPETSHLAESHVSSIHCVKNNPAFMVSLNVNKNEVIVWNVYEQKAARTLRGIPQPRDIKFIDDRRAVILCNRELCIYDLDAGTFQVKLKGVMNQKMPFYGLHNIEHVVSLSRNRMYVNMMNLNSGDCVATFKVGEDRFLNSLLVSADGSICVCGDETQKPFPLLVWDLNSRKLMYDLRVPQHDFVTSLSAITSDGHFVICVCQEVSDPIPNFVIVYDLQNGTLFKKWKPEVSTCSVAISSEGGCAITGLTNTSVLVWDLTTGACRFTLVGHTAPVSVIQLDQKGQRCLTADLPRCRDPAIRLWDLSKGVCLASFAGAESYITSCQLSLDGHYVVLSLSDRSDIITLMLVEAGNSVKSLLPTAKIHYGSLEDDEKVVNFE